MKREENEWKRGEERADINGEKGGFSHLCSLWYLLEIRMKMFVALIFGPRCW
jgi:hypothetical protein